MMASLNKSYRFYKPGKTWAASMHKESAFMFPIRVGIAMGVSLALSGLPAAQAAATPVSVVETSLGLADNSRLLRHLGLRFGDEKDFVEAHFGPGEGGALSEGFLKYGEGKVADSEYLDVIPAGLLSVLSHVSAWNYVYYCSTGCMDCGVRCLTRSSLWQRAAQTHHVTSDDQLQSCNENH
jgi:hypothetical protein